MKNSKNFILIGLGVGLGVFTLFFLIIGCIVVVSFAFDDLTQNHSYDTYEEAKESIERGWIPNGIPEDSREFNLNYLTHLHQ